MTSEIYLLSRVHLLCIDCLVVDVTFGFEDVPDVFEGFTFEEVTGTGDKGVPIL